MMKKNFEYRDEVSNKFWEINLKGKQVVLTFGRIGIQNPQKIIKERFTINGKFFSFYVSLKRLYDQFWKDLNQ